MQPHPHNNTEAEKQPPQEAPSTSVDARLQRIEAGIADLQTSTNKEKTKDTVEKRKASRSTVTLAFAFLGLKVGGLIGGKAFIGKEAYDYFTKDRGERLVSEYEAEMAKLPKQEAAKSGFLGKIFPWMRKQPDNSVILQESVKFMLRKQGEESAFWKRIAIYTGIAGAIGAAIGAVVGWTRGDRLDDPYDLIKHPIESIKKIFGPAPKGHKPLDPAIELPSGVPQKPENIIKNEKDALAAPANSIWQERIEKQSAERESTLSAANFM